MGTIYQDIQYVTIVDEVTPKLYYVGYALPNALETDSVWTIIKVETIGNITKQTCPDGKLDSKYQWSNRLSYTYQ